MLRSVLDPPWSLRIQDEAPLTVVVMVRGEAWVVPDDGDLTRLRPGEVVIVRGPKPYTVADDPATSWEEKLAAYRGLVDDYYEADRFREFCARHLAHADECMAEYISSDQFDAHLVETIRRAFPAHEHEQFVAHYRGLLGAWVNDQAAGSADGDGSGTGPGRSS